jgi:hypothetical protein
VRIKKVLVHIINILNLKLIMDKKVLKMYEAPEVEIVDLELESQLLAGSGTNADNADVDDLDDGGAI